jgi:hypothetical protein
MELRPGERDPEGAFDLLRKPVLESPDRPLEA